uniref:NADH-ubiquinone oxidoreductase chain 4L n=1 Tax=Pygmaeconus traillii TaxID=1917173 RepID=A0A1L3N1Z2_9COND|nr:NADH dehydrogenase subunit 4L [Pygmaeconus traillii]
MEMFYLFMLSVFGVLMSLLALIFQKKHLLGVLLSLEAITMSLFILTLCTTINSSFMGETSLIFITLGACEASLGLASLVSIIRAEGNDYVSSLSMHKC